MDVVASSPPTPGVAEGLVCDRCSGDGLLDQDREGSCLVVFCPACAGRGGWDSLAVETARRFGREYARALGVDESARLYVLSYIHGFWNDSNSPPCEVVSLHRTEDRAIGAACAHWNQLQDEGGEPVHVSEWGEERTAIDLLLSHPDTGEMAYVVHRASVS